jgi:hypothetical protein
MTEKQPTKREQARARRASEREAARRRHPSALIAIATIALASCAAPIAEPQATSTAVADAAVCDLLPLVVADFKAGYDPDEAMDRHLSGGWPAGMPSDAVRGTVNAYRIWVAVEGDLDAGVGTDYDAVEALANAMTAEQTVCGS